MKHLINTKGIVFDIQRFSLHDGPGIRTTVFLKGCPLHCAWCHNPESWDIKPQEMISKDENGTVTTKISGSEMSVKEVLREVCADQTYYRHSGGGMTVSGGEPMMQYEFLKELLCAARKQKVHTCVETSGFTTKDKLEGIRRDVDVFLFDIKQMNNELHKKYTGVSNAVILENLDYLYQKKEKVILRCPIISGINDTDEHIRGIAALSRRYPNLQGVEILPYHDMGKGKWKQIGKVYSLQELKNLGEKEKEELLERFHKAGCKKAVL